MPEKLTQPARLVAFALLVATCGYAQATCNQCAATYIPASEIDVYLKLASTASATNIGMRDQQVRAVDAGRAQVGVGIVYRAKIDRAGEWLGS